MRIVHIVWELGTGGVETMLVDIVNEQVKTEEVAIAVVNEHYEESLLLRIDSRCSVELCRRKRGSRNPLPWIKLNTFLYRWGPDIIHFHLEGMRKMVIHHAPKVFTIHNIHTSGVEYASYRKLFSISDGVRNITEQQGYRATTIWNGIRTANVKVKERDYYHSGNQCKIVCVGRLYTPHKGQDILIRALRIVAQQGLTNFHLDLIGDGESRAELEKLIVDCGLSDKVAILGQRDRTYVYEHLCDYNLYVMPSRSEGFGLSVAEAMCAKVPVIVCDLESVKDVVDGGRLGMIFKAADEKSLSMQIIDYMRNGVENDIIAEAREYAMEHFDIRQTARQYIQEYKKLIKK